MPKLFLRVLFIFFLLPLALCFSEEVKTKPSVLVSVAPHKFFLEKIAGKTVDVILMVPPGASSHSYEPTPKQMMQASKGQMWFLLGEAFEAKAIKAIKSYNPELELVDMRQGLNLIADQCGHCHHHHNCTDPHIWLSPRLAKVQAQTIARALSKRYPDHKKLYFKNLESFVAELDQLDCSVSKTLESLKNRVIMVSHPAYAYFCRDYHLKQLSIEFEGKDPTPKQLNTILKVAKENNIHRIFTQKQYSNKAARIVAKEINASVIDLDPYSEHYIESLLDIAENFAKSDSEP
ncbi:MAG: metal ABC transporter solute-binding protein, Zn/Mn family [Parachlamydiaceae bacterium]